MSLKPWREVAVPHQDVLKGTFSDAEFAADLAAVHSGAATRAEYSDPQAFFARTYITVGLKLLLTSVVQRLAGAGGDPVVQLQTAFGGGKTHSLLAVYHLAQGAVPASTLQGIPQILDAAGVTSLPQAAIAVLDGKQLKAGSAWMHGKTLVHTVWGELAWQLGQARGDAEGVFALVAADDAKGTSPGKQVLAEVLARCAPCVVLIDELSAFVRQLEEGRQYSAGTYDSNLSFVQALTEAFKQVPTAMLLASLPESDIEAGSQHGIKTLRTLEKYFQRINALTKPVDSEESFHIVRRRLFDTFLRLQLHHRSAGRQPCKTQVCRVRMQTRVCIGFVMTPILWSTS